MSIASANCRIDWRPSRQICVALLVLGVMAAISAWLSDLPLAARLLLGAAALAQGAWLAHREWRRPACVLEFEGEAVLVVGESGPRELRSPRLSLRGPLASLIGRDADGRRQVLNWCADTLPIASRRQLRLRFAGQSAA